MNLANALRSLLESWQRSLLSAMGIMVASVAILLLVSIGKGVEKDITSRVDEIGVNVLICVPGRIDLQGMGFNPNLGGQSWFKEEDAGRLKKVKGVQQVALLSFAGGGIAWGKKEAYPLMIANTPEWFSMHKTELKEGRLFSAEDSAAQVVILGSVAKSELFGKDSALHQKVKINGKPFEVIGVLEDPASEGSLFSMQSFQNVAYIPFAAQKNLSPDMQIDRIMAQTSFDAEPKSLVQKLEDTLGERLDRQQYSVLTQQDLLGLVYQIMGILSTLVIGLTSIALFVGAVGITTVMIMSVNERRKEIGVLKAIGATQRDVFRQFLWESIIIGLSGVLMGLTISTVVNWGLATFTKIKPLMGWDTVLLAFAVGIGVGAVAGMIPALKAAKQDPVVSLRAE